MTADLSHVATVIPARDVEKILDGLRAGMTLHDLSREHNLSREVIRQIGEQNRVAPLAPDDYLAPVHVLFIRSVSTAVCRALDWGTTYTTLGLRKRFADMSPKYVNSAIQEAELTPLLSVADPPEKVEYTVDDMHAALRAAADLNPGALLTGPTYDRALKSGDITGPSRVLIIQRIGSWAAACEGAGVPYRGARRTYEGFDADKVQTWLDRYGLDMVRANKPITFASYSAWAKGHTGAPSGSLIKARMLVDTTWNQIRDDLILRTYRSQPSYWVRDDA